MDIDDPPASLLLEAINYESYEMPPAGKLPAEQIEILTRWVKKGLPWTAGEEETRIAGDNADCVAMT